MKKLSIITVNLNDGNGLLKTINSVVSQTFGDYEFIIIDGNSSDTSVATIKEYSSNIDQWVSENDTGIYNAMNKGISLASGEYCLFLNSGDWLLNDTVLTDIFAEQSTADIIIGNIYFYNTLENKIESEACSPNMLRAISFFHGFLPHQASFIKRQLFTTIGLYNENYKIASDWLFFLEAFLEHNVSYQHYDGVVSYFNTDGISCGPNTNDLPKTERLKILKEKYPLFIDDFKNLKQFEVNNKLWEESNDFKVYSLLRKIGIISLGSFVVRIIRSLKRKFKSNNS